MTPEQAITAIQEAADTAREVLHALDGIALPVRDRLRCAVNDLREAERIVRDAPEYIGQMTGNPEAVER